MSRAFDASRHCGAKSKRCETDPPTCRHADGIHACRLRRGQRTDHAGSGHCSYHAGATPTGIKHAQKEQAETAVAKLGLPTGTGDPFALLDAATRHGHGMVEATGQVLADVVDKTRTDLTLEAAANLHLKAIRQGATTGSLAVGANVADRMATIEDRKIDLLQLALQSALDRMGGDPSWNERFLTVVGEELVKITAPTVAVAAAN